MKKRTVRLLVLFAALLAIIGAYALVSGINKAKEQTEDESQDVLNKEIKLTLAKDTDITELSWKTGGREITLKAIPQEPTPSPSPVAQDTEQPELPEAELSPLPTPTPKPSYTWVYTADESLEIDQEFPKQAAEALREITVTQTLLKPGRLSEYGLDKPQYVVNVVCADGTKKTLRIGDQNPVTRDYYAQLGGTDMIYLIKPAVVNVFKNSLLDIIVYDPIPQVETSRLVIRTGEEDLEILNIKNAGIMYSDAFTWYLNAGEDNLLALDNDKINGLLTSLEELEWESCKDASASGAALAGYGLDNPALSIEAYEISGYSKTGERIYDCKLNLLVGDYAPDDTYRYAKLKDSDKVYLIQADAVSGFQKATYDALRERNVCLIDWQTVDYMEVTVDGKTAVIDFSREPTPGGTTQETFTVNGEKIIKSTLYKFLETISVMRWVDERTLSSTANAEITVYMKRNTRNYPEITLEFMPYSNDFYVYTFNGEQGRLVERKAITKLKDAFAAHIIKK